MQTSERGVLKGLWQSILSKEDSLIDSTGEAVYRMIQDPSHVALGDSTDVLSFLMKNETGYKCTWAVVPEPLYTSQFALAIQEHSPYRLVINN